MRARGFSNERIALTLNLSEHTVKSHVKALFRTLHVPNRTARVKRAFFELVTLAGISAGGRLELCVDVLDRRLRRQAAEARIPHPVTAEFGSAGIRVPAVISSVLDRSRSRVAVCSPSLRWRVFSEISGCLDYGVAHFGGHPLADHDGAKYRQQN